jgi:hypothetical protein
MKEYTDISRQYCQRVDLTTRNSYDAVCFRCFHLVLLRDFIFQDSEGNLDVPENANGAHRRIYSAENEWVTKHKILPIAR